jgi:FHA domain
MNIKTFGRANTNTNQISKPDISSQHAQISELEDGLFLVEDLNSTNGVYVNGYRINQAKVNINDEVRLSESTIIKLTDIFQLQEKKEIKEVKIKTDAKDFVEEFGGLKEVWEKFNKDRIKLNNVYQRNSTIFRSMVSLLPILVWIIFKTVYLDQFRVSDPQKYQEWQGSFIYFSAIGGSIGNLVVGLFIKSPQAKLTDLDEEFRVRYVCPNSTCRTQLGNIPWKSYHNQGKCFRCQAKYNQELIQN